MKHKVCAFLLMLTLDHPLVFARDLGTQGHTFVIKEESFLNVILNRLKKLESTGVLEKHQKDLAKAAQNKMRFPTPVSSLSKCTKARTFFFDPSITIENDITDHVGRVIARKGTQINPLSKISLSKDLLFIDGKDDTQVLWALKQEEHHKIILTNGSPLDLEKRHKRKFYFDQDGQLSKKFTLAKVPSRVKQEGLQLRIDEIDLNQEGVH